MGKTCYVPYCKSGYRSNKEKVSLFRAPSDSKALELWRRAIPRNDLLLTNKHHVCEKHFSPHLIRRYWTKEHEGKIIMEVKLGIPKLEPDAVPTLFPGLPKYLSKPIKPPRIRRKRVPLESLPKKAARPKETRVIKDETAGLKQKRVTIKTRTKKGRTKKAAVITEENLDPTSFKYLWKNTADVCLPNGWGLHKIDVLNKQRIIFFTVVTNDENVSMFGKQVCYNTDSSSSARLFVLNRAVAMEEMAQLETVSTNIVDTSEEILALFSKKTICSGGPRRNSFRDMMFECAAIDSSGVWRHNRCPVVINGTCRQCKWCATLHIYQLRRMKSRKLYPGKRVRYRTSVPTSRVNPLDLLETVTVSKNQCKEQTDGEATVFCTNK